MEPDMLNGKRENTPMDVTKDSKWDAIKSGANGFRKSTKQLCKRVQKSFRGKRKEKETVVQEIHITQDSDTWAVRRMGQPSPRPDSSGDDVRRSINDVSFTSIEDRRATSAGSTSSQRSCSSKENDDVEVVHDMEIDPNFPHFGKLFS